MTAVRHAGYDNHSAFEFTSQQPQQCGQSHVVVSDDCTVLQSYHIM